MNNKVILLVEDDSRDQALILRALNKSKIVNEVVVARDGESALDFLSGTGPFAGRDTTVTPQFILLDLALPKMSGLEVLKRLRSDEQTKRVPVVVFTSSSADEDLVNSYNLGANSFVRKPVDSDQFSEAIRNLGLYWLVLNQVARILIADDQAIVRDGVKKILDQSGTMAFGEASTTREIVRLVRDQDWDITVMDLTLDGQSSIEIVKEIKNIRPDLPVLILATQGKEEYARRALKAGAAGYITKDSPRTELVTAVSKLMNGGRYVSPAIAEKLISDISSGEKGAQHEALSDREFEVLRLIASGKTVGQIAQMLSLSDRTVSTYRARILEKMGMKTNAALTHYAIQNRLVE